MSPGSLLASLAALSASVGGGGWTVARWLSQSVQDLADAKLALEELLRVNSSCPEKLCPVPLCPAEKAETPCVCPPAKPAPPTCWEEAERWVPHALFGAVGVGLGVGGAGVLSRWRALPPPATPAGGFSEWALASPPRAVAHAFEEHTEAPPAPPRSVGLAARAVHISEL